MVAASCEPGSTKAVLNHPANSPIAILCQRLVPTIDKKIGRAPATEVLLNNASVKDKIRQLEQGLPEGVVVRTAYDRSALIERSIDTLKLTLLEELAITTLICLIFLNLNLTRG